MTVPQTTVETVASELSKIPFVRFLGFELTELTESHATATLPFADRLIGNPIMEYYHGGVIASFMEVVAAVSVASDYSNHTPKPIDLTVDYLQPALKGPLYAKATINRKGKRIASVQTVCWQEDISRPVASGLYHFLTV